MANGVETLAASPVHSQILGRTATGAAALSALWRFCRKKPLGAFGGMIVLAMIIMAVLAPWIARYSYDETIRGARMKPPGAQFWMGTDNLGRDMWSRVVYGARISVTVGFGAVLIAQALAACIGITSGYFGGRYDICVQRIVDAWQSFPFLVVILSIMAVLGPGLLNVTAALGVVGAANASRVIRGTTISVAQNVYIESARALGAGHLRIMVRHILPNVAATLIVLATIGLGAFILAESALSFLGFGVPPPYPSWGGMLSGSGRAFFLDAPWIAIYPGLAISMAVFGFNMLGDALRDVLDPRLRGVGGRVR
ncbi:MAG: ABC transporter permease [Candidatus Rokuibacteriota bacterium]|nr:MAG: ABC transporter permease [Candidatus Rokubacteria bacterium]